MFSGKLIFSLLVGTSLAVGLSDTAVAVQLNYTFSGIASGDIGGTTIPDPLQLDPFGIDLPGTEYVDQPFSISIVAETDDIFAYNIRFDPSMPPTSFMHSNILPTFTLGDQSGTYSREADFFASTSDFPRPNSGVVGLSDARFGGLFDTLTFTDPMLAGYDLQSPLAVSAIDEVFLTSFNEPTTLGNWRIDSIRNATFTVVPAVPEPSTVIGLLPVLGLGFLFRKILMRQS